MAKININNFEITIIQKNQSDYICITDMMQAKDGDFFVSDWLRNRNTLEFLGIWEQINNPNFNYGEFAAIKNKSGLNNFKISVKEFSLRTEAIGLFAKVGRYGGTFAHKDIALEFAMWISPEFKIYLINEFQRFKENEQKNFGWSVKRELTKINYRIHTDAIKQNITPLELTNRQINAVYANEADILNVSLFGITAKTWRDNNPKLKGNIRDYASINQLICLANLESINSIWINENLDPKERIKKLNLVAINQMKILEENNENRLTK